MSRRDFHHPVVVQALEADGWTITDDPLPLMYGGEEVYVDLGAEQVLGAEKGGNRIAVEIKGFVSASDVSELEKTIGQCLLYEAILAETEPDRVLFLAVPSRAYRGVFRSPLGQLVLARHPLRLIVFDETEAKVLQWIP